MSRQNVIELNKKAAEAKDSGDAMRFSQAACNVANAMCSAKVVDGVAFEPSESQIKHMVDRFLGWKLPANFRPDCGIHFDADEAKKLHPQNHRHEPSGTNLFDSQQTESMIRYLVANLPGPAPNSC